MKLKISKIGFPEIMKDNDMKYISYLLRNISEVDDIAEVRLINNPGNLKVTVILSNSKLKKKLIEELKYAHYIIGMEPIFSKCNKISNIIYMDINT